jgi:hypothetical protein
LATLRLGRFVAAVIVNRIGFPRRDQSCVGRLIMLDTKLRRRRRLAVAG